MIKYLILFLLFVLTFNCHAEQIRHCQPDESRVLIGTSTNNTINSFPECYYLSIRAGSGEIRINFDGTIELKNTDLDEASKEFWKSMASSFPIFKQNIIDEYKCQKNLKEN